MTNIHFNRRLQIEPPADLPAEEQPTQCMENSTQSMETNRQCLENNRQSLENNRQSLGGDKERPMEPAATSGGHLIASAEQPASQSVQVALGRLALDADGQRQLAGEQLGAAAEQWPEVEGGPWQSAGQVGGRLSAGAASLAASLATNGAPHSENTHSSLTAANGELPAGRGQSHKQLGGAAKSQPRGPRPKQDHQPLGHAQAHTQAHTQSQAPQPQAQTRTGGQLDIESARQKLIAQVEKHPFWSNKAAKRMRLLDVCQRQIYVYELVSYCERRDLEWRFEPFRGLGRASAAGSPPFPHAQGRGSGASAGAAAGAATSARSLLTRQHSALSGDPRALGTPTSPSGGPSGSPASGGLQFSDGAGSFSQPPSPGLPMGASPNDLELGDGCLELGLADPLATPTRRFAFRASEGGAHSPIRRSCSSAAGSPARGPPLQGRASALSAADPPLERLLPDARFVWSIEVPVRLRPAPFSTGLHTCELPHSSFVKRCHGCSGRGRLKCNSCYGVGYEVCLGCSGRGSTRGPAARFAAGALSGSAGSSARGRGGASDGRSDSAGGWPEGSEGSSGGAFAPTSSSARRHEEPGGISQTGGASGWQSESCQFCHGAGQKRCWICAGRAYQTCTACAGTGQLRCFLNLNVSWLNHRDESVLNNSDNIIPRDRLKLSSGLLLLDQTAARLQPLESSFSLYAADLLLSSAGGAQAPRAGHSPGPHRELSEAQFAAPPPEGATSAPAAAHHCAQSAGLQSAQCAQSAGAQCAQSAGPQATQSAGTQSGATLASTPSSTFNSNSNSTSATPTQAHLSQLIKATELNQLHSASTKLLERHQQAHAKQERLLRQRHRITQIECFVVNWEWKRRRGHFVIYGDERKVYIAKYPFKSICSIT